MFTSLRYIQRRIAFVLLVTFLFMINVQSQEKTPAQPYEVTNKMAEQFKVALVTLKISENAVLLKNISLVNTSKRILNDKSTGLNKDDLVCFVLNKEKQNVDTLQIIQPLKKRYEYPAENGAIGSKIVDEVETEVVLRFNYSATMKYLRIERVGDDKNLSNIITLLLPDLN